MGPLGHLLPYHQPVELAHRVAYLDHLARGRYMLGVGISALPSDHDLFALGPRPGREPAHDLRVAGHHDPPLDGRAAGLHRRVLVDALAPGR